MFTGSFFYSHEDKYENDSHKHFFSLGYYQVSRTLLTEALTIANYNDNQVLKADIYHGLALLAIHEGNNGQALQHLKNAQVIGGDENFWMVNLLTVIFYGKV